MSTIRSRIAEVGTDGGAPGDEDFAPLGKDETIESGGVYLARLRGGNLTAEQLGEAFAEPPQDPKINVPGVTATARATSARRSGQ